MVDEELLKTLGLGRGCTPLTKGQFGRRIEGYILSQWPLRNQLNDPAAFAEWQLAMKPTADAASEYFVFNWRLAKRAEAEARLARYRLAEGRPEETEEVETGEFDEETGAPLLETVVVRQAIAPLEPTIEREIRDEDTGEVTGTETIENPAIIKDKAERVAAQAVLAALPKEVMEWPLCG